MKNSYPTFLLRCLLALVLLSGTTTLLPAQSINPGFQEEDLNKGNQVILFEHPNFTGLSTSFGVSSQVQDIQSNLASRASAIVVPKGYAAHIYHEDRVKSFTLYPGNYPNLGGWNDDIRRIQVLKIDEDAPVVYLIDEIDQWQRPSLFQGLGDLRRGREAYSQGWLFCNDCYEGAYIKGLINVSVYSNGRENSGDNLQTNLTDLDGNGVLITFKRGVFDEVSGVDISRYNASPATLSASISSGQSDYFATVNYTVRPPSSQLCGCGGLIPPTVSLAIEGDRTRFLPPPSSQSALANSQEVAIGPGVSRSNATVSYNAGEYARECRTLCGYSIASRSGLTVSTADLRAPTLNDYRVSTTGEIILNWTKNSDVPDELITTHIIRNDRRYQTIPPSDTIERTFVDRDFSVADPYTYRIEIEVGSGANRQVARSEEITAFPPAGIIEGNISTLPGGATGTTTPVSNVAVCATLETDLANQPDGAVYCDTTDSEGNYRIERIYYGEEASFRIVPMKDGHGFDPDFRVRQLTSLVSIERRVDFTDTTSFVLSGNIAQLWQGDSCSVGGVELLVNGNFLGDRTDANGNFSILAEQAGRYVIEPRLGDRTFSPASLELDVDRDLADLFFRDETTSILDGYVRAGCEVFIGQSTVRISSPNGCLDTTVTTLPDSGYFSLVLPSRAYQVEVVSIDLEADAGLDEGEVIGFFGTRDYDLSEGDTTALFTYRKPPILAFSGLEAAPCSNLDFPILEQGRVYDIELTISEEVGVCPVDTGSVRVVDNASFPAVERTLPIRNGLVVYSFVTGEPILIAPYVKTISFTVDVDGRIEEGKMDVIVTGVRPREKTFATVTPELPLMILRDPPGDASYSYLEDNASLETALSFSHQDSESEEKWNDVKVGFAASVGEFISVDFAVWGSLGGGLTVESTNSENREYITTITSGERFSTSDNETVTGTEGDVFVGAAINMIYALADELRFNATSCSLETDTTIVMGQNGFATTYAYTEDHIRNTLIPQLNQLATLNQVTDPDTAAFYNNQVSVWEQTLQRNEDLKAEARFVENRSFSANASYESFTTASSSQRIAIEYNTVIDREVAIEAGLEAAGSGVSGGNRYNFRMETGESVTTAQTAETTTGYFLSDDDQGDFFTVDIKTDPVYNTPVFDLISGRSSCPLEPGTQPRDDLRLLAENPVQANVDPNGEAVFRLLLQNTSQSEERRDYELIFNQASNPDGARIRIGGSEIQGPIPFSIPAGEQSQVTVTVARGPEAFTYQDLEFTLRSACDPDISRSTRLSAYFQSDCSPITLAFDQARWSVSGDDDNELLLRLRDYDKSSLDRITIQYAAANSSNWQNLVVLQPGDLADGATGTQLRPDVSGLADGAYQLRARLECPQGFVYSESTSGNIDRLAPEVFGIPEPADDIYNAGDALAVAFNEPINCLTLTDDQVTLTRTNDGSSVMVSVGCSGNTLLFRPEQSILNEVGVNFTLTVTGVADRFGNVLEEPVSWTFSVGSAGGTPTTDFDGDGIPDAEDNCDLAANPDQSDLDMDGIGDACDDDLDGDGVANAADNAPFYPNPDQEDANGNGIGDVAEGEADGDGDGIINRLDNCPTTSNADQMDTDGDGIGDVCDDDLDGDGVPNGMDNCVALPNTLQNDTDGDGRGDACAGAVSVREEALLSALNVFPNPAREVLYVTLQPHRAGTFSVELMDFSGRRMTRVRQQLPRGESRLEMQVAHLPAGLYLLTISDGAGIASRKVFIE